MTERSDKFIEICAEHSQGYRACQDCPLLSPCGMQAGDTVEIFNKRMNDAAEKHHRLELREHRREEAENGTI